MAGALSPAVTRVGQESCPPSCRHSGWTAQPEAGVRPLGACVPRRGRRWSGRGSRCGPGPLLAACVLCHCACGELGALSPAHTCWVTAGVPTRWSHSQAGRQPGPSAAPERGCPSSVLCGQERCCLVPISSPPPSLQQVGGPCHRRCGRASTGSVSRAGTSPAVPAWAGREAQGLLSDLRPVSSAWCRPGRHVARLRGAGVGRAVPGAVDFADTGVSRGPGLRPPSFGACGMGTRPRGPEALKPLGGQV